MDDSMLVKVDNNKEIKISKKAFNELDAQETTEGTYHVLHENRPFTASIIKADFYQKKYTVEVNANRYEIQILDSLDVRIAEMGLASASTKSVSTIEAPMPGLILDIQVEIGQTVQEDDSLLILEAMKMENVISSPREGVIKSIHVNKGDAVEKKNILIEFE
jgi:biotin carboxyl carrier protein